MRWEKMDKLRVYLTRGVYGYALLVNTVSGCSAKDFFGMLEIYREVPNVIV